MRILSFPGFPNRQPGVTAQDWSQQEIADFYRAHRLLVENGAGIGLDRGLTDVGEPWMVFYDLGTQDVFMHVARINGRCILVCDQLDIRLSARNITDLIADFENAIRQHLTIRTERSTNSNVVLHPAAKIILSISAVFLLFKLDGGGVAHAKGFAAYTQGQESIVRKTDMAANPRVQSTIARLLDTIDSPRAVAALAGVILTSELLNHTQNHSDDLPSSDEIALLRSILVEKPTFLSETTSKLEEPFKDHLPDHPAHDTVVKAVTSEVSLEQFFKEGFVAEVKKIESHVLPAAEPNMPPVAVASNVAVYHAADETRTVTTPAATTPASDDKTPDNAPLAVQTVADLIGIDFSNVATAANVTATSGGNTNVVALVPLPLTSDALRVTDISISSLDKLDDLVGFSLHTSVAEGSLKEMIVHFLTSFDNYDVEYMSGKVLIEQAGVEGLKGGDIGIWTNVMADGSSISIVGHADLIDDAATVLS